MTLPIMLYCRGRSDFAIHQGERFCLGMGWDEMIGQLTTLTRRVVKEERTGGCERAMMRPLFAMTHIDEVSRVVQSANPLQRTLVIYTMPDGEHFNVHEGENSSGLLSWPEMLGQVIALTIACLPSERLQPGRGLYAMATPDTHIAYMESKHARRVKRDQELAEDIPF